MIDLFDVSIWRHFITMYSVLESSNLSNAPSSKLLLAEEQIFQDKESQCSVYHVKNYYLKTYSSAWLYVDLMYATSIVCSYKLSVGFKKLKIRDSW